MSRIKTEDIIRAAGGRELAAGPASFSGVSTDSRTVSRGELFVPLVGENFDGHDFIGDAFNNGASGTLVAKGRKTAPPAGKAVIEVPDTLRALGDIAHYFRMSHKGLAVVGITGTNGKTTTKEMLASVLSARGPAHKNEGNLNNEIGLPLSIFGLKGSHWAAVFEMGMSSPGEIARLAEIASPDVGVITNIGPGHLETLGSLEGVAAAKAELIDALGENGKAVLNFDDPYQKDLLVKNKGRCITFGLRPGARVTATGIEFGPETMKFRLEMPGGSADVNLPALGLHNVINALAAAAAASALGLTARETAQGLSSFSPVKMRMEITEIGGARVINDAYNANPASMASALNALGSMKESRKVAVLGDMLELGPTAARSHFDAGRLAFAEGVALLVLIGQFAQDVASGAVEAGMDRENIFIVESVQDAASVLSEKLKKGDSVLVKGSRRMGLEEVVEILKTKRLVA